MQTMGISHLDSLGNSMKEITVEEFHQHDFYNPDYQNVIVNVKESVFTGLDPKFPNGILPVKFGYVGVTFAVDYAKLKSFDNFPHTSHMINMSNNNIKSLVGLHKVIKKTVGIGLSCSKIISGGLGLLLIDGLTNIVNISRHGDALTTPFKIIQQHLGTDNSKIFRCQKELIDAGYEEYAKL